MNRTILQVMLMGVWAFASSQLSFNTNSADVSYSFQATSKNKQNQAVLSDPSIVILGSSTAAGVGSTPISPRSNSWVGLLETWLTNHVKSFQLTNLARNGFSTASVIATGDPFRNITRALSLNPDIIVVNLPSNNVARGFELSTTMDHYQQLKQAADSAGALIFFTTTQPRNFSDDSLRQELQNEANLIRQAFGDAVIDIYDELTDFNNAMAIKSVYSLGDGIHVNNAGHAYIFEEARKKLESVVELSPGITSFRLINAFNDEVLTPLNDGSVINLNEMPTSQFNIEALSNDVSIGSVQWQLTGAENSSLLENLAPYSVFGNIDNDFFGQALPVGNYTLTATPYTETYAQGNVGISHSIQFEVVDNQIHPSPVEIILVDADLDQDIRNIEHGDTINLSDLNTQSLNIRSILADVNAGSYIFNLTGTEVHTRAENEAPYALFGDVAGDFQPWVPSPGEYTLNVEIYSGEYANGTRFAANTINFTVIGSIEEPVDTTSGGEAAVANFTLQNSQEPQILRPDDAIHATELGAIKLYPNPVAVQSQKIHVTKLEGEGILEEVILYSAFQKEILKQKPKLDFNGVYYINLPQGLNPGTYYLRVNSSKNSKTIPLYIK